MVKVKELVLVKSEHKKLTITEQYELLSFSRSSYYYKPKPLSPTNIKILHNMDEIYTSTTYERWLSSRGK